VANAHELGTFERYTTTLFESKRGDLYALADATLLWRRDRTWHLVPLPAGVQATDYTDGFGELADGRVLFNAPRSGVAALLAFDPDRGTLESFVHPLGRQLILLAFADGRAWLHSRGNGFSWLETFDGRTFARRHDAGAQWHVISPRGLLFTTRGDILVLPEQTGVGVLQPNGPYRVIGRADGYPGAGPFWAGNRARCVLVWRSRRDRRIRGHRVASGPLGDAGGPLAAAHPRRGDLGDRRLGPSRVSEWLVGHDDSRRRPA